MRGTRRKRVKTIRTTYLALFLLGSGATFAHACDDKAVLESIEWIRLNNADAYKKIENGCKTLSDTIQTGLGLTLIAEGHKEGQAHNQDVAKLIDSCTAVNILQICDKAIP